MSGTKSIETALAKSTHIVEGILLNLEHQSELDEATANTWSNTVNVINGELSVVCRLLQNITGVHIPPLLIAAQMTAQTNEVIRLLQQWPALLEVRLMRDGIDAHPWSRLHLLMAPEASSARAPSIEVIDKAHPPSTAVTAMAPPAVKVEQVVGNIEMGDSNSNNNNVVSKAIAKGKGKERAAIDEVGEDAGQEVMVKTVAKEAKGKGKAKEVGEERAVKQGKGKGKGKEVVQEGVAEQTTVTEKSKNKGKWRKSSKGTKKTRGCSQSTATSKFKSVELVPSDSEDERTGLTPRGPSPTPSVMSAAKVQAWPASTATARRSSAPRPLHVELEDPQPPCPPSVNTLVHACRRWRRLQHPNLKLPAPQKSTVERHGSRGWSIQATQRKFQWGGHSPPIPLFFTELRRSTPTQPQAQGQHHCSPCLQRRGDRQPASRGLDAPPEGSGRSMQPPDSHDVPLPTSADVDLMASLLRHGPEGPLPENQEGGGYNTPSAPSVNSPANPLPPLPMIPKSTVTPTVLLPPPVVLAPLPAIPRQSAPPAPSPSLHPPSEDIAQSSAPPIAVLSAPGTPSSGPDIVTTPKADMQAPGPAGAPEALPVTIGAAEAGQPPRAVSPMDDVQATPHVTTLEVDTRSTTAMGSAMQEQHAAVPISATQVDAQADAVEAEGVAEPSTPLALPVWLPPPSPEHRATALLALTTAYDDEEQMEVDN
ncbi:hypothetical protein PAXRUDRAFT_19719 [Paxillus rubicundulus Ve08.2h10]|uniref:Uncharacterized protein n=1 Tax=Paxillus rubicundulus Ve08.2h10 TaxID=930991 RepID=A0A0D0CH50_9AGAM|nr:hypothetical protein PAXRUDRAFT_19719 [Paxillus rubicundulus Ve08.2h10]